ncbi:hypothetical protein EV644_14413 [Kribbella orskensis]|uniref:Tripartite tricarboxylate transporter TctB family protein n=1 Tax=Kribbella orskensis TaxID=2512216 RepID=A0ABY2B981_9ACTN|nr:MULTISPECIES: hypothetical protein [Kribbella]TCN28815.1 hypothetical protein EV642_14721 [Kribbella sp. VKM Ac-2500]TCO08617.1 hypothetical protein EV644_14413 [Kribbella orskensis]
MSTATTTSNRFDVLNPVIAAVTGAVTFGLTMTAGEVFGLNSDPDGGPATTLPEIALYVGIVVAAMLIAVWLGLRARAGSPRRLSATALGLAIAAAVTYVAFWSGWPQVFGAVAVVLAVEHRRRVGSFSAATLTALILGAIAFMAAAVTCVLG